MSNLRDTGVERLRGDLRGKPRARREALVSVTDALTVAAVARTAMAVANFMVTGLILGTARTKE